MFNSAAKVVLLCCALVCSYSSAQSTQTISQAKPALSQPAISIETGAALLVIIIDDLGNNLSRGKRAVELPGAITYGILPHTPLAKKLAFYASQIDQDKEVIIHMPMEANSHKHLGPGGLEEHLNQQDFTRTLHRAMDAIPFAKGLSNHMGSKLTSLPNQMQWLMTELGKTDFYFIDSKTTGQSLALTAAANQQVPYLARDIFIDHDPSPAAIDRAYQKALALAKRSGLAVAIAHPYPSTLDYLERVLPELARSGVSLVTASEAIKQQAALASYPSKPVVVKTLTTALILTE